MKTILVTGGTGLVGNAIKTISANYNFKFIFLYYAEIYEIKIDII